MWFVFALLAAFFDATYYALIKKYLQEVDQYALSTGVFFSSSVILFVVSWFNGFPALGSGFFGYVFATGLLNVVTAILYLKALKTTDLSIAIPMISFTPLFLIVTSFVVLKELPTLFGAVGMLLIIAGSYILNTQKGAKGFFQQIKAVFSNQGTLYMLAVAFLFSISSNFDKLVVLHSDVFFGSAAVLLFLSASFLFLALKQPGSGRAAFKKNAGKYLLAGIDLALGAIAVNVAFTMQIVPYVISLKRLSILFSVFYGGMVFKEENMARRSIGALIIFAGVILIILS